MSNNESKIIVVPELYLEGMFVGSGFSSPAMLRNAKGKKYALQNLCTSRVFLLKSRSFLDNRKNGKVISIHTRSMI
jgi:hypothetical protein